MAAVQLCGDARTVQRARRLLLCRLLASLSRLGRRLTLTLTLTLALALILAPLLVEVEHEGARALDHPPAAQRGMRHPARA